MNQEYTAIKNQIDRALEQLIRQDPANPLAEAMAYGISTPGKRIRGVLTVYFCRRLSVPEEQAVPFAVALELIHAYSLVHDDMPEMDNDAYRRGLPTCHKKYGPALALLAGDAILNYSMEYLLSHRSLYRPEPFLRALEALYQAAGSGGMLRGQAMDKIGESHALSMDELFLLHRLKTGALLSAPIEIASALSGTRNENYVNYCRRIGLAFQIKDDLLDVEGSPAVLGKETGRDSEESKSTFVSVMGVNEAKKALAEELEAATAAVSDDPFLCWLAGYIGKREK